MDPDTAAPHPLNDLPPRLAAAPQPTIESATTPEPQPASEMHDDNVSPGRELFRRLYVYPMWHTSAVTSTILGIIGAGLGTWVVVAVFFHDPDVVAIHTPELVQATISKAAILVADALLFPFTREMLYTVKSWFHRTPATAPAAPRTIVRTRTRYVGTPDAIAEARYYDTVGGAVGGAVGLALGLMVAAVRLLFPVVIEILTFLASIPLALIALPVCIHRGRPQPL